MDSLAFANITRMAEQTLEKSNPATVLEKNKKRSVEVQGTRIFYENQASLASIIVNRGSARSSKSYSLAQLFCSKFLSEKKKKFLILRRSLPSLRLSVYQTMKEVLDSFSMTMFVREERVGLNWFYGNNFLHFGSIDDIEKIKCFHPDTDVFTKEDGFKNIKEIKVGDLIATMNPKTKKVEYQPVSKTFVYDYDGPMLSPVGTQQSHIDFCVTPEHKMLIQKRKQLNRKQYVDECSFVKAKDLTNINNGTLVVSGDWSDLGKEPKTFSIPRLNGKKITEIPMESWLKFLGWFLSEGYVDGDFTVCQTKAKGIKELLKDLKDFTYQIKGNHGRYSVYGKDLASYLKQFGKSDTKFIPKEIKQLSPRLLLILLDALIAGDGIQITKTHWSFSSVSKQLVKDVAEIAIKCGFCVSVTECANIKQPYNVSIKKQDLAGFEKFDSVAYKGKVYCIEVEPYHTLLTQYNGKSLWTGNSTEWNYIWIEEATDFEYSEYQILRMRMSAPTNDNHPNQIFLSFNPVDEYHWIKSKIVEDKKEQIKFEKGKGGVQEIISTYKDNPFLSADYISILEGLIEQDFNFYRIYALGQWGRLENLIYTNWDIVSYIPQAMEGVKTIYGLDFGYNDPMALERITYKGLETWEEQLIYKEGFTVKDLLGEMDIIIPREHRRLPIYCDTAEPDKIRELKEAGYNAKPAHKSVLDGIDFVKRFKCHILGTSSDLIRELRTFSWKTDKNLRVMDEPVEFKDHLMSARRYALFTHLRHKMNFKVRWLP